jgi:hypothetical protein
MHVQAAGGQVITGMSDDIAALYLIHLDAGDIDCGAAARNRSLLLALMSLQPPHPAAHPTRQDLDLVPNAQLSIAQRPGDHGTETGN